MWTRWSLVPDTEISEAVLYLLVRPNQMVEAAGATPVSAIRSDKIDVEDETVVPILNGDTSG